MPSSPRLPRNRSRLISVAVSVALAYLVLLFISSTLFAAPPIKTVPYSDFLHDVAAGVVAKVEQAGTVLTVTTTAGNPPVQYQSQAANELVNVYADIETAAKAGGQDPAKVQFSAVTPSDSSWLVLLVSSLLPVLIIGGFLWYMLRSAQGANNQAISFGRSKARMTMGTKSGITFADVAGVDEAKAELQEVVEFLKFPEKFNSLGARIPRGVLLVGPTGTGKTLLAKAVSGEAGVPFFSMSGSEFVEMFVGVGASVTGDTPVLVRDEKGPRLVTINEVVDPHYSSEGSGYTVPVEGLETLSYEGGKRFEASAWRPVKGVYRHWVEEIYEIKHEGGVLRTTGDHSVFVRRTSGVRAKAARDLRSGDVLVTLPQKSKLAYDKTIGTQEHRVRAHGFSTPLEIDLVVDERALAARTTYADVLAQPNTSGLDLAFHYGVSPATISYWRNGRHKPMYHGDRLYQKPLPDKIPLTIGLLRLMGYYTAEGDCANGLRFTFSIEEGHFVDECERLVRDIFGLEPSERFERPQDHSYVLSYGSNALGRFFALHCGPRAREKHVPAFLWNCDQQQFLAYLATYGDGDGYLCPKNENKGSRTYVSASKRLLQELCWLSALHGIKASVNYHKAEGERRIGALLLPEFSEWWSLTISGSNDPFQGDLGGSTYAKRSRIRRTRVESIERRAYQGYVYDFVGVGENEAFFGGERPLLLHNSRARDLFEQAKRNSPSVIFIDELDAIGRQRGAGVGSSFNEHEQTLNQLLIEMDGFDTNTGTIVIGATNRPDVLDPALLRPGRFDRQVVVDRPDMRGRIAILRVHSKGKPLDRAVDLEAIARQTPGFSGADLANLINEAAILAARRNHKTIAINDFAEAVDRVIAGPERKSRVISDEEKVIIAYHEGGHAVVQRILPKCDPVSKVTIISRGMALGYTMAMPTEDRYLQSKSEFEDKIAGLLGGNAAELLVFGDTTTGAANDLEKATNLARRMVTEFGMSDKLGPRTFGHKEELVFLGRELGEQRNYSDEIARQIDEEVLALIKRGFARATEVLVANRARLDALAQKLVVEETVDAAAFETLFADLPPKPGRSGQGTVVSDPEPPVMPVEAATSPA